MAEFFGDLERLAADAYPYRWAILAGIIVVLIGVGVFGYRKAWHLLLWRRRLPAAIVGVPLVVLFGFLSYDLGSPLFTNKTVEEEFPFAFGAEVPPDMDREDVEKIMSGLSKVDFSVQEDMPEDSATTLSQTGEDDASQSGSDGDTAAEEGVALALKSGNLRDADSFHKGEGIATIYLGPDGSHFLRLEDLDVTNGPDLHVLLSPHEDPMNSDQVKEEGYVDLGKLKGNRGNQNYTIPDEVDPSIQNSVIIYCAPFHVIFSVAPLTVIS